MKGIRRGGRRAIGSGRARLQRIPQKLAAPEIERSRRDPDGTHESHEACGTKPGRRVSKSATKKPRSGISDGTRPGISTIVVFRYSAVRPFVADLDTERSERASSGEERPGISRHPAPEAPARSAEAAGHHDSAAAPRRLSSDPVRGGSARYRLRRRSSMAGISASETASVGSPVSSSTSRTNRARSNRSISADGVTTRSISESNPSSPRTS